MASYKAYWHTEGHIVVTEMINTLSESEYAILDAEFSSYIEQRKGALVHFVFDMSQSVDAPDLKKMTDLKFVVNPAMGWSITIGGMNPATKFMITMAAKINRARFKIVNSLEEAIDFLYTIDPNLPSREQMAEE